MFVQIFFLCCGFVLVVVVVLFSILHPETRFSSATLSLPAAISHYQRDAAATRAMRTTEGSMTRFDFFQKPTFAARSAGPEKNDNKANSGEQESAGDGGFGGGEGG